MIMLWDFGEGASDQAPGASAASPWLPAPALAREALSSAIMLLTAAADALETDDVKLFEALLDELCLFRPEQLRISTMMTLIQVASGLSDDDTPAERRLAVCVPRAVELVSRRFGPSGEMLFRAPLTAALAHVHGERHLAYQLLTQCTSDSAPSEVQFGSMYALSVLALLWAGVDVDDVAGRVRALALALASEPPAVT